MPTNSSGKKAREASQSTKARILATAQEVFAARGFAGASTREIAGRAGVNISSLHYHWESKETLYRAVFESIYERILALAGDSLPQASGDRSRDRAAIEAAMAALFDYFADNPDIARLLMRRFLEDEDEPAEIEADVLAPAWRVFDGWVHERGGGAVAGLDVPLFTLTMYVVVMMLVLDSRHAVNLLGGGLGDPATRARVRRHVAGMVPALLGMKARPA